MALLTSDHRPPTTDHRKLTARTDGVLKYPDPSGEYLIASGGPKRSESAATETDEGVEHP